MPLGGHLTQGDFRMAASSGIVFAEALLGRDGRVSAQPGAWYPEEVLSLNRVEASLRRAGIDVTKTEGRMFPPRSVPACVPSEPDGLGLSRSRGSGPQARLRPRAPLARIVEDIARAEGHY